MPNYDRRKTGAATKPARPQGRDPEKAFKVKMDNAKAMLEEIGRELGSMQKERDKAGKSNWGYVGDIGHVEELLWDTLQFMRNAED